MSVLQGWSWSKWTAAAESYVVSSKFNVRRRTFDPVRDGDQGSAGQPESGGDVEASLVVGVLQAQKARLQNDKLKRGAALEGGRYRRRSDPKNRPEGRSLQKRANGAA